MESPLTKSERIDLGLALLSLAAKHGVELTAEDIAAWCDCGHQTILNIEAKALAKVQRRLARLGLDLGELEAAAGGPVRMPHSIALVD